MVTYEEIVKLQLYKWKLKMRKNPNILEKASKGIQRTINDQFPEKYHELITNAIKNLFKAVLFGTKYVTKSPIKRLSLRDRERLAYEKTRLYKNTAIIEGAATGAGGFVAGLADFPLLLGIKIKFLYELASIYGYDVDEIGRASCRERV